MCKQFCYGMSPYKDGDVLMEKVVLYVGLTDEENKALSSEEIESVLSKRTTTLLDYANELKYDVCGIYKDGYYIGDEIQRINLNKMVSELKEKSVSLVLTTYNEIISEAKDKFNTFIGNLNQINIKLKAISERKTEDTIASRRNQQLKDLMDECKLEYVSSSIINLLNLDIKNDERFLDPSFEIKKRAAYVREIYNSEYNWYGKNVILYVRLSEEDKDKKTPEELSESIKNQLSMLLKHAKANRWIVVAIFCDEDYSGVDNDRPEYNKCLRFCEVGKTDIVLCKMQSRFTRDMEHVEKYIHGLFPQWGIRFVGKVDNADTVVKGNKKSRQINGLINEWYLEDLSENIRDVFKDKHANGQFTGPFAPYGYMKDPDDKNHLIPDPVASVVVKKIFELYAYEGYGVYKIITYLKEHNIPCPYEYKLSQGLNAKYNKESKEHVWGRTTVRRILNDVVYIGHLAQSRTTTPSYKNKKVIYLPKEQWIVCKNTHEPIIDMATWNKAQEVIENKARACKGHGVKNKYSGMIECDCCHKNFKKISSPKNDKDVEYFRCAEMSKPYHDCNNTRSVRVDALDNIICESINNRIEKYKDLSVMNKINIKEVLGDDTNNQVEALRIEKKDIEKKIAQKDNIYQGMYEDLKTGIIDYDEYKLFKENFKIEKSNLSQRLEVINKQLDEYDQAEDNFEEVGKLYEKYTSIKEVTREILNEFVERIYIGDYNKETDNRDITIKWRYQF